jgi:DNA-binding XRE family transcriptional regulator
MFAPLTFSLKSPNIRGVEPIYLEFGRRFKAARIAAGFNQEFVASFVGLSRTSITNIESGRQRFPLHVAYQLADSIGQNLKDLLPAAAEVAVPAGVMDLPDEMRTWAMSIREQADQKGREVHGHAKT